MYAVIFITEIKEIGNEYREYVEKLRELGKKQGCRNIYSVSDGTSEITVSLWDSRKDIEKWLKNPLHREAQSKSHKWYKSFRVLISEVKEDKSLEGV